MALFFISEFCITKLVFRGYHRLFCDYESVLYHWVLRHYVSVPWVSLSVLWQWLCSFSQSSASLCQCSVGITDWLWLWVCSVSLSSASLCQCSVSITVCSWLWLCFVSLSSASLCQCSMSITLCSVTMALFCSTEFCITKSVFCEYRWLFFSYESVQHHYASVL